MFGKLDLCLRLLIALGFGLLAVTEIVMCNESDQFVEQTAFVGTSYKMKCTGHVFTPSNAHTTITIWSVNGSLPRGPKYKLLTDGMVIRNVSTEDGFAYYACTILDRVSFTPLHSENVKLRLKQREAKSLQSDNLFGTATEKHTKVWGIVNQWIKLQCNVLSRPRPTFSWRNQQNGEEIGNITNLYKIMDSEFTSNLTIFLHNETMFGKYICEASNDHGSSIQNFNVAEGYRPKSPFIYPVFISKDKLTLKVQPQEIMTGVATSSSSLFPKEKLPIISYFIQYADVEGLSTASGQMEKENDRNKKWITVRHSMPVHEISSYTKHDGGIFELRNLKERTTYLVRSAVANVVAISDFSPAIRITTEASKRNVTAPSNALTVEEDDKITKNRENFGRSSNYEPEMLQALISNTTQPIISNYTSDCKTMRFKKTIIKTTTTTTLIENLDNTLSYNNAAENSSLVKKHVEESTSIDRTYLCSI